MSESPELVPVARGIVASVPVSLVTIPSVAEGVKPRLVAHHELVAIFLATHSVVHELLWYIIATSPTHRENEVCHDVQSTMIVFVEARAIVTLHVPILLIIKVEYVDHERVGRVNVCPPVHVYAL